MGARISFSRNPTAGPVLTFLLFSAPVPDTGCFAADEGQTTAPWANGDGSQGKSHKAPLSSAWSFLLFGRGASPADPHLLRGPARILTPGGVGETPAADSARSDQIRVPEPCQWTTKYDKR